MIWTFAADDARDAEGVRASFLRFVQSADAAGDFAAAELAFGELIGNVVRHAPGPIDVHVEWTDECPVLSVSDRGNGFELRGVLPHDPLSENGRGLFLVSVFCENLAIDHTPGIGTTVRVTLPIRRASRFTAVAGDVRMRVA